MLKLTTLLMTVATITPTIVVMATDFTSNQTQSKLVRNAFENDLTANANKTENNEEKNHSSINDEQLLKDIKQNRVYCGKVE